MTDLQVLKPDSSRFVVPQGDNPDEEPEKVYYIERFCFIKSLMMLELLGNLAEEIDVASIFTEEQIKLDQLIEKLPLLLRKMRPTVTRVLSLTLMKNRDLEKVDREGGNLDEALKETELMVAYRLDIDLATELLGMSIERIGIQNIRKNFPTLLAAIQAG